VESLECITCSKQTTLAILDLNEPPVTPFFSIGTAHPGFEMQLLYLCNRLRLVNEYSVIMASSWATEMREN